MEKKIIECVPNFSEGRNMETIRQITDLVESTEGVKLLGVDPGKDTNRTVVTFVGEPGQVVEAAFRAIKKASELIDMSKHHGEHPRIGATDVCPLVPVSGITMEETVAYARELARRIGDELKIPVYCYENAAYDESRRNLADIRKGEYEGLKMKITQAEWKPDFGPAVFNARSGATIVGARDFLVAYNVNLNTTSTRRANAIAYDVREKGRNIKNENGEIINVPGTLKNVKAIGWFIEEYGFAQVSMNLTNISVTPVHVVFDEVSRAARERGVRVTGSELVGLIPLKAILEAGRYFLMKQQRSAGVSDEELVKIAVKSLGLDEIQPFNPDEKIIEYVMRDKESRRLVDMSLQSFMNLTASEAYVPGGGSVSAYMGSLGVALGTMVANISSHKRGWDNRWEEFHEWAEKGKKIQNQLLTLVDEDTEAYRGILAAYGLPKNSDAEKAARTSAIQEATKKATLVPFTVIETAFSAFPVLREMVSTGNPNSVTDAAVGAIAVNSCIRGAFLNVQINAYSLKDREFAEDLIRRGGDMANEASRIESEILEITEKRLTGKA